MQEKEFDKLMTGGASKLAFIPKMMPLDKITSKFVKENEVPAPKPMVKAVDIWIDRCKKLGMSEKNIRKSVLRKFNIKLVKESPQEQ
jgi:hypothetical protein